MNNARGQLLRKFRKKARLSGEQLGNLVGCHKTKISKLERGEQDLDIEWAKKLAPHLGIEPLDLLPDVAGRDDWVQEQTKHLNDLREDYRPMFEQFIMNLPKKEDK